MALTPSWPGVSGLATTTHGRKALAGLIVKNAAGVPRSGVFPRHLNSLVTARSDMNVNIGIFEAAAVQFGGAILLTNDATAQLPSSLVSPGVGITNYYVIYAKQNESASPGTDANNNVIFGAVLSTSSFDTARASGARMDASGTGLPTGAVELATVEMPTGKTATNQSLVVITQTFQYTAAAGGTVVLRSLAETAEWEPADGAMAYRMSASLFMKRQQGAWRDLAFAEAHGSVSVSASGLTHITFPTDRFTVPPIVQLTPTGHANVVVPHLTNLTATGCDVLIMTLGSAQVAATMKWSATQMSVGNAAG